MGININLDTTATDISSISFENEINETMSKTTKKVYPNDPCPCGSGQKLKSVVVTLLSDFKILCLGLEITIIIMGSNVRQKGVKNLV